MEESDGREGRFRALFEAELDYVLATLCGVQSRTGPVSEILAGRASLVV